MKVKLILVWMLLIGVILSNQTSKFKVDGMTCAGGCAWKVNNITKGIDGVIKSEVDFENSMLTVEYDNTKVSEDLIISTLTSQTTYKVRPMKEKSKKQFLEWFKKILK